MIASYTLLRSAISMLHLQALKKTEVLENELNLIRTSLDAIKTPSDQKVVVRRIVELTNDISQAVIPYWKKVCCFLYFSSFKK